jgi:hypothetical protein
MGIHFDQPYQISAVYYLESKNQNMNPIAIRPAIAPPDYMSWEDTGHGRIIHISKILIDGKPPEECSLGELPERIEVISDTGEKFKFIKLTKEIFDRELKRYVGRSENMNFHNDYELQDHYLHTGYGPGI